MQELADKLLKISEITECLCAPGVVAEALDHLMQGESAAAALQACVRHDPVLLLRLHPFVGAFDPARRDLLRALLLAVPVASAAEQAAYAQRWRQSLAVAHLAQALAVRSGTADRDAAWTAGLSHNLGEYLGAEAVDAARVAPLLDILDADGWTADAVRYHAAPLPRGRAAHPLVRVVQLAYLLATRADAVDSVDVRAALGTLQLGAGDAAQLLADSRAQARLLAQRHGVADTPGQAGSPGFDRLARFYAGQAAQSALHDHFRGVTDTAQGIACLRETLHALFGIERVCLFTPAGDGLLRASPLTPVVNGLAALAIPPDDAHSALPRALARNAPQRHEVGMADGALVDEQIARLLGVSLFVCQPLPLPDGQTGVLLAGDAMPNVASQALWRFVLDECVEAWRAGPRHAPAAAVEPAAADAIPRDRVRRAIHEVANPLTIMRNYVNLLSARLGADSAVQRDLSIIGDEIERVARIVRGVVATPDAIEPAPVPFELASVNGVVSELVRMALGTLLTPNKVSVQIDLNPDVPPLLVQKDLLKQVLFNLAKNAVEAMPGGGHLRFTTRLIGEPGQRMVEIEVADTGPGLPPAVAARLFDPVDTQKGGDHAGLGLAISRGLVERMNGRIECDSTPQGTRFLIRLPTVQDGQALPTTRCAGST